MTPPPPTRLLKTLYRSLLRTSTPFSTTPTLSSLLHRSGTSHDWEECIYRLHRLRKRKKHPIRDEEEAGYTLPKDWAMNLSRSYEDLREEYVLRREFYRNQGMMYDEDDGEDNEEFINVTMGSSNYRTTELERKEMMGEGEEYYGDDHPKVVLFRHLLREYLSGCDGSYEEVLKALDKRRWTMDEEGFVQNGRVRRVPCMRWPCQIENEGLTLRDLIRKEFRAPSVEEREEEEIEEAKDENNVKPKYFPPSSYIDNHIRVQTAFMALVELNRKLAWGEKLGLVTTTSNNLEAAERHRKKLLQAAKGITPFPFIATSKKEPKDPDANTSESTDTPNNLLQCGTYLIAHPLMTGYFAKSVIILLDHATSSSTSNKSQDNDTGSTGGTYGLIINRLALQPISQEKRLEILRQKLEEKMHEMKTHSANDSDESMPSNQSLLDIMKPTSSTGSALQRPVSLIQAVQPSNIPESVQEAFGGLPLREGGPVNFSLQMMHRRFDLTNDAHGVEEKEESQNSEPNTNNECEIGGTQIPHTNEIDTEAIYFGGDVIKASLAVNNGKADPADFSFVVGASCWTSGQLQSEIERGCWLPFRGPSNMAMTGMCEHNDVSTKNDEDKTMLSMYPPRPSNSTTMKQSRKMVERPSSDLWLSIMCALGDGEGDLAYAFLDERNVLDELGDTCDNFDRT